MDNELYHHGIIGQKWGIRRYQNEDGTLTKAGKNRIEKNNRKEAKNSRKKDLKNKRILTDKELKEKVDHLILEKQLKDLTDDDVNPGKKFVKSVVSEVGKRVAVTALTGTTLYGLKSAISKDFNWQDFGASIFYGGPKKK